MASGLEIFSPEVAVTVPVSAAMVGELLRKITTPIGIIGDCCTIQYRGLPPLMLGTIRHYPTDPTFVFVIFLVVHPALKSPNAIKLINRILFININYYLFVMQRFVLSFFVLF